MEEADPKGIIESTSLRKKKEKTIPGGERENTLIEIAQQRRNLRKKKRKKN